MNQSMQKNARVIAWTVAAVWLAVFIGGALFLRQQNTPFSFAIAAALVAAAIEVSIYVLAGLEPARDVMRPLQSTKPMWLAVSVIPAHLIYTLGTGTFAWPGFLFLLVLAALVAWWYVIWPNSDAADLGFLILVAAGLLTSLIPYLYPPLSKVLRTDYIGRIMWLRLSYWAILVVRDRGDAGFGFLPRRIDWLTGLRYAALCIPAGAILLWAIQPMKLKDNLAWSRTPLIAAGTFLGFLWVVALSEELFFRGLIQPIFTRLLGSPWRGLMTTSLLFGSVHISSFGRFPNWRLVALAAMLGAFCGRAAQVAGSIRAGMVTHALVVAVYRVLLTPR